MKKIWIITLILIQMFILTRTSYGALTQDCSALQKNHIQQRIQHHYLKTFHTPLNSKMATGGQSCFTEPKEGKFAAHFYGDKEDLLQCIVKYTFTRGQKENFQYWGECRDQSSKPSP